MREKQYNRYDYALLIVQFMHSAIILLCWVTIDVQTQLTELNIPLKLHWKKGIDMPDAMSESIQAVVIGDSVYIGGGYCSLGDYSRATVFTSYWVMEKSTTL